MNFKTTIALLVLLGAIGAYLFFTSGSPNTDATSTPTDPARLFTGVSADVTKLTISPRDEKPIVLEKSGTDWLIKQPIESPADTFAVTTLLDDVVGLSSRGQVDGATDASAGLDKPRYTIDVTGKDGNAQTVHIGNLSTLGSDLYLRRGNDKAVLLAPGGFEEKLEDVVKRVRDPKLVKTSTADIKQLRIERPGQPTIRLVKTGSLWNVTEPFTAPADTSAVTDLLSAVTGLRATEFVAETQTDAAKFGLDKPQATIVFEINEPSTQPTITLFTGTIVTIGRYDDVRKQNVYATTGGAVARVPVRLLELAEKPATDLRSKEVVKIDPDKVTTLTVSTETPATTQPTTNPADGRNVVVRRRVETVVKGPASLPSTSPSTTQASTEPATQETKSVWQIAKKPETWADANDLAVNELLGRINPVRAQKYVASVPVLPTLPAGKLTLSVTTEDAGKVTQHQISITEGSAGKPAVVEYDGLVFEVEASLVEKVKALLD